MNVKISGNTIIDHDFRVKLNISCDEYVAMDFIYCHNRVKRNTFYSLEKLYKETGFSENKMKEICASLIEKKLMYRSQNGILFTSVLWNEKFSSSDKYEEIWKMFCARGVKIKGLNNYKKALLKYPEQKLFLAAKNYIATKDISQPNFIMGIEKFFDIKNKIFEQYITNQVQKSLIEESLNEQVYEGKFGK